MINPLVAGTNGVSFVIIYLIYNSIDVYIIMYYNGSCRPIIGRSKAVNI